MYNNGVLVGNWIEERLKNEDDFKFFLRKRDRRELLLQKARTLYSNLLKERLPHATPTAKLSARSLMFAKTTKSPLQRLSTGYHPVKVNLYAPFPVVSTTPPTASERSLSLNDCWTKCSLPGIMLIVRPLAISGNYIMFGFNVQLVAPDISVKSGGVSRYGLALSSVVGPREVDCEQNVYDGCIMTLSPITTPCCRNTFVILSTEDESTRGKKVNYGDQFLLKAENYGDPSAPPLYVRYQNSCVPEPANLIPIHLSAKRDTNCRWTTVPLLPRDRLEGIGQPIQTSTKLIIKNCVADKSLSVMYQNWRQTFFGMECGVNCRDFIDTHKRFTAENIFSLVSDVATKKRE